jgi:hypothetical protein
MDVVQNIKCREVVPVSPPAMGNALSANGSVRLHSPFSYKIVVYDEQGRHPHRLPNVFLFLLKAKLMRGSYVKRNITCLDLM